MRRASSIVTLFAIHLIAFLTTQNVKAVVQPEFPIDPPAIAVDPQPQTWPAIAFNGFVYVVVWQDEQAPSDAKIRFAVFNANGQSLGPMQTLPVGNARYPEIASNGKDFLLIWRHEAPPASQTFAARLDVNGNFVPESVIGPVTVGEFPKVASNGADYIVFSASPQPAFSRVTDAGFGPVTSLPLPETATGAAIASDGTDYMAVWVRISDGIVRGARVSAAGEWIDTTPFAVASSVANNPTIAFSNGMYLVLLERPHIGSSFDLVAQRITPDGTQLDGPGMPLITSGFAGSAAVGPYRDGFRIIYYNFDYAANRYEVRTLGIGTNGIPSRSFALQTLDSTAIQQLAINARGPNSMIAWASFSPRTQYDVFAKFIGTDGVPSERIILQTGPNIETAPAVGSGANGYLVVWQDNRNSMTNRDDIYGRFVDAYGRPKGNGALPIARGSADQTSPSVAAAGDHYLVAWREIDAASQTAADIKAALLVNDTVVKEFTISAVTNDQRAVAVGSNGRDFLIVWRDSRTIGYNSDGTRYGDDDIYGMHVTHDGELSGPPNGFPICQAPGDQAAPVVASNGTNYLVAWRDPRDPNGPNHIYGAIVNTGDTNTPAGFQISFGTDLERAPDVASNGRDYFVVWRDARNQTAPRAEIYGTPVLADGKVGDTIGIPLVPASDRQHEPAIASIGDDYMLAWLEFTGLTPLIGYPIYNARARIIHSDGSVGPASALINTTPYDQDTLVLAADRQTGIGLIASQLTTAAPRVQIQSVCLSNCPVVLSVTTAADGRTLAWNAEPNRAYRIEFKRNLNEPTWSLLTETSATADGFLQAPDASADSTRFYRVVLAQ